MRRGCLVAVALLVAAAVFFGGWIFFRGLPYFLSLARGEEFVAQWLRENADLELAGGRISPLFLPGPGVQVRGLDLKIPDGKGGFEPFFSAKKVKVVLDLQELWKRRKLVVRQVLLERPSLRIKLEPSGQLNIARWAESVKAKKNEAAAREKNKEPEKPGLLKSILKEMLVQTVPRPEAGIPGILSARHVTIEHGELRMEDLCPSKKFLLAPLNLSGIGLEFHGAFGDQPARLQLSFPFPQGGSGRPAVFVISALLKAPSPEEIEITSFSAKWKELALEKLSGRLRLKPLEFRARIRGHTSFSAFYELATWPPIAFSKTIPDMEGHGRFRVEAEVWGPDFSRPSKVHYRGRAEIIDMTWYPGRVLSTFKKVNTVVYLEDGVLRMPETTVVVGGNKVTGKGKMIEAKLPRFVIDARAERIDFATFFQPRKTPYPPGRPMLKMRTLWGGRAFIKQGVYGKIKVFDAEGEWNVNNKRLLTFPELRFRACGGTYEESGRSFVDFNDPVEYRFRFDGAVRGMDVTRFADQVFDATTFLHGRVDADGFVLGRFLSGEFVPRSLEGRLAVTVRDGYFEGLNLVGEILAFFKLPVPKELKGQQFKRMTMTARFEKGVAYTEDIVVDSPFLHAEAKGWIDFPAEHTDLKIKINFLKPLSGLMKNLPIIGVVTGPAGEAVTTLYVRASGHWDHLKYSAWNPRDDSPPPPPPEIEQEKKK